jgi:hypothetical protein
VGAVVGALREVLACVVEGIVVLAGVTLAVVVTCVVKGAVL